MRELDLAVSQENWAKVVPMLSSPREEQQLELPLYFTACAPGVRVTVNEVDGLYDGSDNERTEVPASEHNPPESLESMESARSEFSRAESDLYDPEDPSTWYVKDVSAKEQCS